MNIKENNEDWDPERIMTVEASGLRCKTRALQKKCFFANVGVLADVFAVIMWTQQSLDFQLQGMMREQSFLEVEMKLQVVCRAALSAQKSALAKVEEARKFCKDL